MATTPGSGHNPRYDDPAFRLGFARQVTHCWRHSSWLADDELVAHAGRLAGIPGWLVHGRLDVSSPVDAPWRIHQAWPDSQLEIVETEGHGGETMMHQLATDPRRTGRRRPEHRAMTSGST